MDNTYQEILQELEKNGNLRKLPVAVHEGKWIVTDKGKMLNLSSNDYLGLAAESRLQEEFLSETKFADVPFTASSSRLLTGNFSVYTELENWLSTWYGTEGALIFNSGYHMNTGILPAVADSNTLILADKLVHASLIDGIRLSAARCIRYRHHDYDQLKGLLAKYHNQYGQLIIVTESVFSMDGDVSPLAQLAELKKQYDNVLLYVDEAHAFGVRGNNGLGIAEEQHCIQDIDFLCGTFGKAAASVGGFLVCRKTIRDFLINRMRTLIFTTALPPVNIAWTLFILQRFPQWQERRQQLHSMSERLRMALQSKGYACPSESHIVPLTLGASQKAIEAAERFQRNGFYVLPVRPPTVPEGTSRLRFSLTAAVTDEELDRLITLL